MPEYELSIYLKNENDLLIQSFSHTFSLNDPAPTPDPDPEPDPGGAIPTGTAWVHRPAVNVRAEPNTDTTTEIYQTLSYGDSVEVSTTTVNDAPALAHGAKIDGRYLWRFAPKLNNGQGAYVVEQTTDGTIVWLKNIPTGTPAPPPSGINWTNFEGFGSNGREYLHVDSIKNFDGKGRQNIENVLALYPALGLRGVRVYLHWAGVTWPVIMDRLRWMIGLTKKYGLNLMVAFDDSLAASNAFYDGFKSWHTENSGHLHSDFFVQGIYKKDAEYLRRLREVSAELAKYNHTALDLMNEPALYGNRSEGAFYAFRSYVQYMASVANTAAGGNIPITVGIINCQHITPIGWDIHRTAKEFYANVPALNMGSIHAYVESNAVVKEWKFVKDGRVDMAEMRRNGKKASLGEFGIAFNAPWPRRELIELLINEWMADYTDILVNALYWGIDTYNQNDMGIHDAYGLYPHIRGNREDTLAAISLLADKTAALGW